jgi:hypothetical protein
VKFYVFTPKQWTNKQSGEAATFFKVNRKWEAMHELERGNVVFKHEPGIPNPWWVRRMSTDGKLGELEVI